MNKKYIAPIMEVINTSTQPLMEGSVNSNNGIGWGGYDPTKDPESRNKNNNIWDEEDDF